MKSAVLSHLRLRLGGWLLVRVVLTLVGALGGVALAATLGDAALDFSETVRAAAPWMLGICGLVVLALGGVQLCRMNDRRVAAVFERRDRALGDRLTNAVLLAEEPMDSPVGEYLRREAVALGRRTAAGVRVWPVVKRPIGAVAAGLALVALAWLSVALLGGDILRAVLPRFADPQGDHPPFSRLKIHVTPGRGEVLFGGQLEVRAETAGRPVDKLWLVAAAGTNVTRTMMFVSPEKTFFQTLANLREAAEYYVTDGRARSHRFPIAIRYTPQITLVELTTEFPSYTGRPARTMKLTEEPQAVPLDTRVKFRVASNRPLRSGRVALTPVLGGAPVELALMPEASGESGAVGAEGQAAPARGLSSPQQAAEVPGHESRTQALASSDVAAGWKARAPGGSEENGRGWNHALPSQVVAGAFTLTQAVAFVISVRDVDGLEGVEPKRGRLNVRPDERPRLVVLEPGRDAVATPAIRVPVKVQATDDYGVERVAWLRGHNRSLERPLEMKLERKAETVESQGAFDLAKLGVRPGDVIEYYFEAADSDPRGPNVALSRPFRLEIISEEQYRQVLRQTAARKALFEPYFRLGAWLGRLAERARKLEGQALIADSDADKQAVQDEAKALAEELDRYHEELSKLLRDPAMFDIEQAFRTALVAEHTRAGQAARDLRKALQGAQCSAKDLAELSKELSDLARQNEREVTEPARHIAAVAHLLARADAFVRLAREQAALARMLRRFSEKPSLSRVEQMEARELAYQQQRIEQGLRALLGQLPELLSKVPDEAEYAPLRQDVDEFIRAVGKARIEDDLRAAAGALDEPDTMTGFAFAQRAAESMDKLIGKCQGLPREGQQCLTARFRPKLPGALGTTLAQVMAAMGAGQDGSGPDGYGMFNDDVSLYGPSMELAGEQGGPRGTEPSDGGGRQFSSVAGGTRDASSQTQEGPGRVKLQPDAKFPLRYRDLVGEYFKAIAETENEGGRR